MREREGEEREQECESEVGSCSLWQGERNTVREVCVRSVGDYFCCCFERRFMCLGGRTAKRPFHWSILHDCHEAEGCWTGHMITQDATPEVGTALPVLLKSSFQKRNRDREV